MVASLLSSLSLLSVDCGVTEPSHPLNHLCVPPREAQWQDVPSHTAQLFFLPHR